MKKSQKLQLGGWTLKSKAHVTEYSEKFLKMNVGHWVTKYTSE